MKKLESTPKNPPATNWWHQEAAPYEQMWNVIIIIGLIVGSIVGYNIGLLLGRALPKNFINTIFRIGSIVIVTPIFIFIGFMILEPIYKYFHKNDPEETEKYSLFPDIPEKSAPPPQPPAPSFSVWGFKTWRKKNKLTQKALGQMLGISARTISAWENYREKPTPEIMQKLRELKRQYDQEAANATSPRD